MMILRKSIASDVKELTSISTKAFDTDVLVGGPENDGPPGYNSEGWHREMMEQNHLYNNVTQNDTQCDTQNDTQGGTIDNWIEEQIRKNPKITTEELAKLSGKSVITIKRHITKLSHIKYVGSGYSGHWEIIK